MPLSQAEKSQIKNLQAEIRKRRGLKATGRLTGDERLGQRIEGENLSFADSLNLMKKELESGAPASKTRFIPEALKPLAAEEEKKKDIKGKTTIRSKQVTNVFNQLKTALELQKSTKEGTPEGDKADEDVAVKRLQLERASGRQFRELSAELGDVGRPVRPEPVQQEAIDISSAFPNQTVESVAAGFIANRGDKTVDDLVQVMTSRNMSQEAIQAVLDEIGRLESTQ